MRGADHDDYTFGGERVTSVQPFAECGATSGSGCDLEAWEIKHLELVQSVISRMAQQSFQLKGWSVTVATAIFAFAAKESSPGLATLALFPAIAFWCLDAFYLRQERLYRKLYEAIADPVRIVRPFSMDTSDYAGQVESWRKTLAAKTILPLHAAIVLIITAEVSAFLTILLIAYFKV
jgi:hypothetical protein